MECFDGSLQRPWFERIWVIQEFISAKTCPMWCGKLEFEPDVLLLTASMLAKQRHAGVIAAGLRSESLLPFVGLSGNVSIVRALKQTLGPRGTRNCRLIALLWPLRDWKATDERDKVFALVGLADGVPPNLVDYSLNARQVYVLIAKIVLWDNPRNPLVMLSYLTSDGDNAFPSWVPTWTSSTYRRTPLVPRYRLFTPPAELLEPPAKFGFLAKDVMTVQGKIIDTIDLLHPYPYSNLSKIAETLLEHNTNISAWLSTYDSLIQGSQRYTKEDAREVLWRTIIYDSTNPYGFDIPSKEYGDAFRTYHELTEPGLPENITESEAWRSKRHACMSQSWVFQTSLGNLMPGRQSCFTRSGYVGAVPLNAQVGDRICIFQGYPIPFVIKPAKDTGCYQLVAEAYLHGLMNGEAFKTREAAVQMIKLI